MVRPLEEPVRTWTSRRGGGGVDEEGGRKRHPIGINLSPNPGCRRGEGGWVDAGWAFMVARGGACWPFSDEPAAPGDPRRATIKAHFSPRHHPRFQG